MQRFFFVEYKGTRHPQAIYSCDHGDPPQWWKPPGHGSQKAAKPKERSELWEGMDKQGEGEPQFVILPNLNIPHLDTTVLG